LICFAPTAETLRVRRSGNDGSDCRISSKPKTAFGGYVENRGKALFELAKEKGLEGIIAKRKTSIYMPGKRSPDWLKIKSRPQQEFVVCGFTEGKGSRKHFGALLLGASETVSSGTLVTPAPALVKEGSKTRCGV
jgi:ATP-dependent DNA ligase